MCNLKEKTDLKTVTVYKAVEKIDGKYYSYFAGTLVKVGKVEPQTPENTNTKMEGFRIYENGDSTFNSNMVGKCSGFKSKSDAESLTDNPNEKVLKVVLGGEIWIGDASQIANEIPDNHIVYAGSKILSIEEI